MKKHSKKLGTYIDKSVLKDTVIHHNRVLCSRRIRQENRNTITMQLVLFTH